MLDHQTGIQIKVVPWKVQKEKVQIQIIEERIHLVAYKVEEGKEVLTLQKVERKIIKTLNILQVDW